MVKEKKKSPSFYIMTMPDANQARQTHRPRLDVYEVKAKTKRGRLAADGWLCRCGVLFLGDNGDP